MGRGLIKHTPPVTSLVWLDWAADFTIESYGVFCGNRLCRDFIRTSKLERGIDPPNIG